ncbi:MAG: hypothetical protein KJ941_13040 [Bacteroidetes bacterium]|nr:hypothetical protein [Bacteroidota bacterium]
MKFSLLVFAVLIFGAVIFQSCNKESSKFMVKENIAWRLDSLLIGYAKVDSTKLHPVDGSPLYYAVSETKEWPCDYLYLDFDKDGLLTIHTKFLKDSTYQGLDFLSRILKKSGGKLNEKIIYQTTYKRSNYINLAVGDEQLGFIYSPSGRLKNKGDNMLILDGNKDEKRGYFETTELYLSPIKKKEIPKD